MKNPLVRSIVGVVVGVVTGFILIALLEMPAYFLHPFPQGADPFDPQTQKEHIANAPLSVQLIVLAAYAVGGLAGCWLAARIAGRAPVVHAGIVAGFFLLSSVLNLSKLGWTTTHPWWFIVVNLTLFVPVALLASALARPKALPERPEMVTSR